MELKHILYQVADGVATITINRADVLNALSAHTVRELDDVLATAERDASVRVLIVTGAGEKSFVSGADIAELARLDPAGGKRTAEFGQSVLRRLETMGKPSIAARHGVHHPHCRRHGQDWTARGDPGRHSRLRGDAAAAAHRRPRYRARSDPDRPCIDAQEAQRIGLVSQVVPPADLMESARKTALRILRNGPLAIQAAMQSVNHGLDVGFEQGCEMEAALFGLLCATADTREGLKAFLEKRKAEFKGQ
jgi:enoyl-CoA hydratase